MLKECVLPVCEERNVPFAIHVGEKDVVAMVLLVAYANFLIKRPGNGPKAQALLQRALAVDPLNRLALLLHAERLDGRSKRVHLVPWRRLPEGAFVDVEGAPFLVLRDRLRGWSAQTGYGDERDRPARGTARVLTPPASLEVMRAGYDLQIG